MMRGLLRAGRTKANASEQAPAAAVTAPASTANPPLTAAHVDSVRFNVSEPQGYFFPQVEEFVAQAKAALRYWEDRDFQHEQAKHAMQVELDNQVYDVQTLRAQIEVFRVQGSPLVNADGSYVTESQQHAGADASEQISRLEVLVSQAEAAQRDAEHRATQHEAAYTELSAWADEVAPQIAQATERAEQAEQRATTAEQALAEAQARITALEAALATEETTPVQTILAPAAAVPAVQPATPVESLADASFAEDLEPGDGFLASLADGEDDGAQPLAVVPVESELPPGVTVSAMTGPAQPYPATRPGAPLASAPGVPVTQWAPELDGSA